MTIVLFGISLYCVQNALTDPQRVRTPAITEYWKPLADDVSIYHGSWILFYVILSFSLGRRCKNLLYEAIYIRNVFLFKITDGPICRNRSWISPQKQPGKFWLLNVLTLLCDVAYELVFLLITKVIWHVCTYLLKYFWLCCFWEAEILCHKDSRKSAREPI